MSTMFPPIFDFELILRTSVWPVRPVVMSREPDALKSFKSISSGGGASGRLSNKDVSAWRMVLKLMLAFVRVRSESLELEFMSDVVKPRLVITMMRVGTIPCKGR